MLKRYAHATTGSRARAMDVTEREVGLNGNGKSNDAELKKLFKDAQTKKISFVKFKQRLSDIFELS